MLRGQNKKDYQKKYMERKRLEKEINKGTVGDFMTAEAPMISSLGLTVENSEPAGSNIKTGSNRISPVGLTNSGVNTITVRPIDGRAFTENGVTPYHPIMYALTDPVKRKKLEAICASLKLHNKLENVYYGLRHPLSMDIVEDLLDATS